MVGTGFHFLLDQQARGAVVITVHFGPFEEFATAGALDKIGGAGEVVFAAILLAGRGGRVVVEIDSLMPVPAPAAR